MDSKLKCEVILAVCRPTKQQNRHFLNQKNMNTKVEMEVKVKEPDVVFEEGQYIYKIGHSYNRDSEPSVACFKILKKMATIKGTLVDSNIIEESRLYTYRLDNGSTVAPNGFFKDAKSAMQAIMEREEKTLASYVRQLGQYKEAIVKQKEKIARVKKLLK